MTGNPKPVVSVGPTHHDYSGGAVTGVHFTVLYGIDDKPKPNISFLDIPPIRDSDHLNIYRNLLRELGEALIDVANNPRRLLWHSIGQQEIMRTSVQFQGPGPFSINPAQSASARALSSTVEMCLNAIVGSAPEPRPIYLQMTRQVASKLSDDLAKSALDIELRQAS